MRQRLYQGDHPEIASSLAAVATCHSGPWNRRRGWELAERALAMRQRLYQGDHPDVARSLDVAARHSAHWNRRRARELYEQALAMRQRLYQGDHPETARSLNDLAENLVLQGHMPRAWALFWEAQKMRWRLRKREVASPP
jgi:hypothetical protein